VAIGHINTNKDLNDDNICYIKRKKKDTIALENTLEHWKVYHAI
jgi:hypothetical protein